MSHSHQQYELYTHNVVTYKKARENKNQNKL
jgi:hypothetical protein